MPFTTLTYIGFFATVFFAYYLVPKKMQWGLLLLASLVFYGWSSPVYLLLILTVSALTFAGANALARLYARRDDYLKSNKATLSRDEKKAYKVMVERRARGVLTLFIVAVLLILGYYKYLEFVVATLGQLVGLVVPHASWTLWSIALPIGLSFYVFQSLGYLIDVHREMVPAERSFWRHTLFVSYFPQIMQGPIGDYGRLAPQLFAPHEFDYEQAKFGIQRIAWGFFKKLVIANKIGQYIDPCWSTPGDYHGFAVWFFISFLYAVQLYADFSGYMDIACGGSQMLGIKLDENFDCPYFAKSVPEFWRRWHISLSSWFKNYLFYPVLRSDWNGRLRKRLGDNKYLSSVIPTVLALAIVWSVTGLWHGASWGYVAWGVYYGIFMMAAVALEPLYKKFDMCYPKLAASRVYAVFAMLRTFAIVIIGYSIFKPADLSVTCSIWRDVASFGLSNLSAFVHQHRSGYVLLAGYMVLLFLVDLVHYHKGYGVLRHAVSRLPHVLRWLIYSFGIFVLIHFGLYGEGFNRFEYFKF